MSSHEEESFMTGMIETMAGTRLLMTFYPAASSAKDATAVSVAAGEEREDLDITVPERELRTLAGVVRGRRDQRPLAGAKVSISRRDVDAAAARVASFFDRTENTVQADAQGRWRLREIPDGEYTITVVPPGEWEGEEGAAVNANVSGNMNVNQSPRPARRRRLYTPLLKDVEVEGDIADLALELSEGGRVAGTITVEGGKPLPEYVGVYLLSPTRGLDEETAAANPPSTHPAGGEFVLEGLPPGKFFLHVRSHVRSRDGFYAKSITWQGRDLLREPLDIAEGTQVEGVRVLLAADAATLRVRAAGADKKPALNVNVFLMAANPERWSLALTPPFCSTGGEGACEVRAAPGEYLVLTMPLQRSIAGFERELRRRAAGAPRVTLRAGEATSIDLQVKE